MSRDRFLLLGAIVLQALLIVPSSGRQLSSRDLNLLSGTGSHDNECCQLYSACCGDTVFCVSYGQAVCGDSYGFTTY